MEKIIDKSIFIEEAKDFFNQYKLPFELRDNFDGACTFISKETQTILYYNSILDVSINIDFNKDYIDFKVEHYNSVHANSIYSMQDFKARLYMLLEYIDSHKKLKHLEHQLQKDKIHPKWKSKVILEQLSFVGEMESEDEDEL